MSEGGEGAKICKEGRSARKRERERERRRKFYIQTARRTKQTNDENVGGGRE
jgi:hypothetical protein